MMYPLVRDLARDGIAVVVTCRVLDLARQPYYRWLKEPVGERELDSAHVANAVLDAHRDDPEFGYRFLADELRKGGVAVADATVWRHCNANGWQSTIVQAKRNKKGAKSTMPAHDDLVRRKFTAAAPNELWLTDITEHRTREGKLYLCAVLDVWSKRVVGYSIDDRMKARLAVRALDHAVARRGRSAVAGCVLHSDRGSQFRSRKMHRALARHDMSGSMGNVGTCADNAAMESFFALLQKNVLNRQRWATRDELRVAIVTWIERTYHRRRRQPGLGRLTPIEYETIMTTTATQAA